MLYDCLLLTCGRSHTCQPVSVCQIWRTTPQPRRPSQQLVAVCLGQQACIMGVRAKLSSRHVLPHISIFMSYPVPGKARGVG